MGREAEPETVRDALSRRDLLKGAGAAALGGAVAARGLPAAAQEPPAAAGLKGITVVGPDAVKVGFTLNGTKVSVEVEPRVTLLDALRNRLGRTGTKKVCDRGACGACTVWLDGEVVNSCLTLAVDCEGRTVRTIEGLASGGTLHPVQEAFVAEDAQQCGYCTPGMVMSSAALLARNPSPSDREIRDAVAGNLCRCGTYPHVFNAIRKASGKGGGK
ncbi:MAG: (2Fe-2S)-binding protein [Planctomycetota bacterium]|jgi:aerobic-type carbon monoxide dehydrogenase small subunit (CoxS/CutS family)